MKKILLIILSLSILFITNSYHTFGYDKSDKIIQKIDLKLEKVYTKISKRNLKSQVSIYKKLKTKLNVLKNKYKTGKKAELIAYIYDEVKKKYSKVFKEYVLGKKEDKKEIKKKIFSESDFTFVYPSKYKLEKNSGGALYSIYGDFNKKTKFYDFGLKIYKETTKFNTFKEFSDSVEGLKQEEFKKNPSFTIGFEKKEIGGFNVLIQKGGSNSLKGIPYIMYVFVGNGKIIKFYTELDKDEDKKFIDEIFYSLKDNKLREIKFDACGKINKYEKEEWYSKFSDILSKNNISDKIIDSCLSLDKNILLIMLNGHYCKGDTVYKYDIKSNTILKAKIEDKDRGCLSSPSNFGKRDGYIIHLLGKSGDAGCSSTMYYDYNYIENIIVLKKECNICEGDKNPKCENY